MGAGVSRGKSLSGNERISGRVGGAMRCESRKIFAGR
jgi:hypothetical protein